MDYANRISHKKPLWDVEEGADMVMVKPGIAYLDIVREVKNGKCTGDRLSCLCEYAMIKAAAERGLNHDKIMIINVYQTRGSKFDFNLFCEGSGNNSK
jgi:porphobilinogen synthase